MCSERQWAEEAELHAYHGDKRFLQINQPVTLPLLRITYSLRFPDMLEGPATRGSSTGEEAPAWGQEFSEVTGVWAWVAGFFVVMGHRVESKKVSPQELGLFLEHCWE